MTILVDLARLYLRQSPLDRGKWRIEELVGARLPDHEVEVTTIHGFKFALDPREYIGRHVYCYGDWEPEIGKTIRDILKPGDTFVDVGANVGFFACLAALCVGAEGRVLAVEPNPSALRMLRRSIAINGFDNVQVAEVAAGATFGRLTLHIPIGANMGGASLIAHEPSQATVEVTVQPLDSLLELVESRAVSLIKIDAEGAEAMVLQGATELFKSPQAPQVIIEVSENLLLSFGSSRAHLFSFFAEHGYSNSRILRGPFISRFSKLEQHFQFDVLISK